MWWDKVVDGRQGQIGMQDFAAYVAQAKRFQARSVFAQIGQGIGFVGKQVYATGDLFGGILGPNFPNQTWLLGDVFGQSAKGCGHFGAKRAAAGEINLQYNHGLLSIRITDGNSISVFAAVFLSSARNEHDFFSFEASTA